MTSKLAILISLIFVFAVPVMAGDKNIVWLTQNNPGAGAGNTLTVYQSNALNSTLKGIVPSAMHHLTALTLDVLNFDPTNALQHGQGNVANLSFSGTGGTLQLLQTSNPLAHFAGNPNLASNHATASLGSYDLGTIVQVGALNSAELTLEGGGAVGLITQLGTNLRADLHVGQGGMGIVTQIGHDNHAGTLVVAPGTLAAITQIGSGIRPVSDTALEVTSTHTEAISITQTSW